MSQVFNVSYSTITGSLLGVFPSYYVVKPSGSYSVFVATEKFMIGCALGNSLADTLNFEANFKDICVEVDNKDDAQIQGMIANNVPFTSIRNTDKLNLFAIEPRLGSELIIVTHNFADKTTWFGNSQRVEYEALIEGDGFNFASVNPFWIDLTHGKMFDEDAYASDITHEYSVCVVVNGITASMRAPFTATGGDYIVNYKSGTIEFFQDQSGNSVEACYSYATNSIFYVQPENGKYIDIENVEAQFSSDVVLRDTIDFEVWGYNPFDLPNKVCYGITSYKSMRNFVDEALGAYPVVPALGGTEGRGTQNAIYGFPFRYGTIRRLENMSGVELRIRLRGDNEFGGEHATATFYCTVKSA